MRLAHGTVVAGKIVLDESTIADGTKVYVVTSEADRSIHLSPDELAELEAGLAEADRGETIPGAQLFEQLKRHG